MPVASHCQMSTWAPEIGVQAFEATESTLNARASGMPSFTAPVVGSDRTSERSVWVSTKYGPTVISGCTTQFGTAVEGVDAPVVVVGSVVLPDADNVAVGDPSVASTPQPSMNRPVAPPNIARISRRFKTRPIKRSSESAI